jgi:formate dehydrogenase/NADH-quinone oxidoreductase subunit F
MDEMDEPTHSPIVAALEELQHRHGGAIPRDALRPLASELGVPVYRLYGVITFFPHFRLAPPPRLDVRVCTDLSCRLRGGEALRRRCEAAARTRPAGEITVTPVSCLGRCDGAPALAVNDDAVHGLDEADTEALCAALEGRGALPTPPPPRPLGAVHLDPYTDGRPRWAALRRLVESGDVAGTLATLKASGLRGLGGAGFPAAIKWDAVRTAPGEPKYVVCNADESEPGTIKDRAILASVPHLLVEGMAIAGVVTGARHGIVYIRHEYAPERDLLAAAIDAARRDGVLGERVLGSSHAFELEIFTSPGGYICGEESALLEAIEGKRAQPRLKPPLPVHQGLWGRPTVINNVETLAHVPAILVQGPEWYKQQGLAGGVGWKFIGISGHVKKPGVYEIRMGTALRQVIEEQAGGMLDGRALKAVVPSGASSGVLPAAMADVALEWGALQKAGTMMGSSAIVIIGAGTCMVDVALNVARFFARESCGKCWPCRVGSEKIVDLLEAATRGTASADAFAPIDDLAQTLLLTSICGLGQVVPNPVVSVLQHFPDEVRAHLTERRCPEGTCRMS